MTVSASIAIENLVGHPLLDSVRSVAKQDSAEAKRKDPKRYDVPTLRPDDYYPFLDRDPTDYYDAIPHESLAGAGPELRLMHGIFSDAVYRIGKWSEQKVEVRDELRDWVEEGKVERLFSLWTASLILGYDYDWWRERLRKALYTGPVDPVRARGFRYRDAVGSYRGGPGNRAGGRRAGGRGL